jgi:hypothetical protein
MPFVIWNCTELLEWRDVFEGWHRGLNPRQLRTFFGCALTGGPRDDTLPAF